MDKQSITEPDKNVCKYCRNIVGDCRNCDLGSKYAPITRPLFNLALMFVSLDSGLGAAEQDPTFDETMLEVAEDPAFDKTMFLKQKGEKSVIAGVFLNQMHRHAPIRIG